MLGRFDFPIMSRTLPLSHKAFIVALILVIVLAFMPGRWLGWTRDVARIINVPLMPFRDLGTSIAGWLSPEHEAQIREFEGERQLVQEFEELDRRFVAAQMRIAELEEQLEQIQQIPLTDVDVPIRPLTARITARDPRSRTAHVQINRGRQHGVVEHTVAVFAGVHLIGKVTSVDRMSSTVLPITSPEHGPLRAIVIAPDQPAITIAEAPQLTLEPRGDGTFFAEAPSEVPVSTGDIVRLASMADWPRSSMGMVLGVVDSVSDDASLWQRVVIRPRYEAHQISSVVLKIEAYDEEDRRR